MKELLLNRFLPGLTAIFFTSCLAICLFAQTPNAPPVGAGPPPSINPKLQDQIRQTSEARLRSMEMEAGEAAEDQKHIQAAITHMRQDFVRIQVLRNDIARNLVAHKPLDYRVVAEQSAEINKRAHRLNVYMLAHDPDHKDEADNTNHNTDEMTSDLVRLCKLIDSFTENPALKDAATIEANQIAKAKTDKARADRDLLAIIKLSENIQKRSDTLRRGQ